MAKQAPELDDVWDDWKQAVNMTATELKRWLDTDESRSVGQSEDGRESTGHKSGRKIVKILGKNKADLTDKNLTHMRTVIGYIKRHLAQRPSGDVSKTDWAYSLKNWGHDPTQ